MQTKLSSQSSQSQPSQSQPSQSQPSPLQYSNRAYEQDVLTHAIIGAAIEVHRHLGPGHLEAPYERALCRELQTRGIELRAQVPIPLLYKGERVGDYYADLIVGDRVLVELKSVVALDNVHLAQILSYLAATQLQLGLLINFNVPVLKQGLKRVINSNGTRR